MTLTQISCPNCHSPIQADISQLIDTKADPALKSRLLSGTLNLIQCPVCGFQGALATPLVYHDPDHELLLTYVPVEVQMKKDEQEKLIGQLINRVMESLPAEKRKAYLLQPQSVLTMQGLVEKVLEADGITKEEIEAQQAKMRLFEEYVQLPDEQVDSFIAEHDADFDATFFQLLSLILQSTNDPQAREALTKRMERALEASSFGKKLRSQEEEIRAATESLRALQEGEITREALLDLLIQAPNETRVVALVNLIRPALDYTFFQLLTERIESAEGEEKSHLTALREKILDVTEELDRLQEARSKQAAALLKTLMEADDLDKAINDALPLIDELFLGTLQANLQVAKESGDSAAVSRMEEINRALQEKIMASLPAGVRLAQEVLEAASKEEIEKLIENAGEAIDAEFVNALMSSIEQLEASGEKERAGRVRAAYKLALKKMMSAKMQGSKA